MQLEAGKYYTGEWIGFDVVKVGQNDKPAFQIHMSIDGETVNSLCWLGSNKGKDGKSNNDRIFEKLVEFGCDSQALVAAGWREHIARIMAGKQVQAKAEEYNGRTNLKGLYVPGSGSKPMELSGSPFAANVGDSLADSDDLPF